METNHGSVDNSKDIQMAHSQIHDDKQISQILNELELVDIENSEQQQQQKNSDSDDDNSKSDNIHIHECTVSNNSIESMTFKQKNLPSLLKKTSQLRTNLEKRKRRFEERNKANVVTVADRFAAMHLNNNTNTQVIKNIIDAEMQQSQQQQQQQQHNMQPTTSSKIAQSTLNSSNQSNCKCGITYLQCCQMRRQLLAQLTVLCLKYPQLSRDLQQLIYVTNLQQTNVWQQQTKQKHLPQQQQPTKQKQLQQQQQPTKQKQLQQQQQPTKQKQLQQQQQPTKQKQLQQQQQPTKQKQLQQQQRQRQFQQQKQQQQALSRSRKSTVSLSETINDVDDEHFNKQPSEKLRRRRNKPRKRKNTATAILTAREQLVVYINTMVRDALDADENTFQNLRYNKDDDLEEYAEKLVDASLGRIVETPIRINRKNNYQAFIELSSDRDTTIRDGIISLPVARQYAFDGDVVRAFVLNPKQRKKTISRSSTESGGQNTQTNITATNLNTDIANESAELELEYHDEDVEMDVTDELLDESLPTVSADCPKAFVIKIVQTNKIREVVGYIKFNDTHTLPEYDENCKYFKFKALDKRMPLIYIPYDVDSQEQNSLLEQMQSQVYMYACEILRTDEHGHCIGKLLEQLGKAGQLDVEIKAILQHNGLKHIRPYEARFNELTAETLQSVTTSNTEQREDLTEKCIFTIDPATARDLDDAVSLEKISENEYEVGVHISDVGYYLQENSELDNIVKQRCTSIYLVNAVIHMLPEPLCLHCSLLPDQNKYAFSVFWRFSNDGVILSESRFTRSVIRSCAQLAYEHAQQIIDKETHEFQLDELPNITNGYKVTDIVERVRKLNHFAQILRNQRFEDGSLTINNPKVRFVLDETSLEPLGYEVEQRDSANFLIEEFMLLANQAAARFIYNQFPNIAVLRNHAPPLLNCMRSLGERLSAHGLDIDYSSSKALQKSIERLCAESDDPIAMDAFISGVLMKPMARAKYFCSEGKSDRDLWHYALSVPIYTHFTSPIRRYPDILVHRLLAAALNYCAPPKRSADELHEIVKMCNEQQYNAKNADDESAQLFFKRYVRSQHSIVMRCVVIEIFNHMMNVVTIKTGHKIAINYSMQKVVLDISAVPKYLFITEKNSKKSPIHITISSTVNVKLVVFQDRLCGFLVSPDLTQRQINCIEANRKKGHEVPRKKEKHPYIQQQIFEQRKPQKTEDKNNFGNKNNEN